MRKRDGARLRRFCSRQSLGVGLVAAAMLLAAVLATAGLGNQLFWDDEANTAINARNLLTLGKITAWDGRNVVGYSYGGALGEDLGRELRVPTLPTYVAAAGFYLLGGTSEAGLSYNQVTFNGRIPFVVVGVLSIGLLAIWLRRHLGRRFAWYLPPLILASSPAFLLYIRNCRYYALSVALTLAVWAFWAPGRSRGRAAERSFRGQAVWFLRCVGAAAAVVLLISTHYLNAASVLVTLPLFFLDRRYRQSGQRSLLRVIYATAFAYGVWILATNNPFTTDYLQAGGELSRLRHASVNALKFLRDVGTHEFVPWVLVPVFVLPWVLPSLRRMRPLALRGWILVVLVLVYAVLAGAFTPTDMGLGPTAEIRYVVPLIAVGSVMGGLALVILWRLCRPLSGVAGLLLVTTNFLHLGFLAHRADGTSAWWPPVLYRYVEEAFHNYKTGNEQLIDVLAQLPAGTTVRTYPTMMVYPPMFYVPELCYCDQLRTSKRIEAELRPKLGDYLFRERARPDVVFVAPNALMREIEELRLAGDYKITKAMSRHFVFLCKPEIPNHFFRYPGGDWQDHPGLIVLVNSDSAVRDHAVLKTDMSDAQAVCLLGLATLDSGDTEGAVAWMKEAVRIDPECRDAQFHLGGLLMGEGEAAEAVEHLEIAVELDPGSAEGHVTLGAALHVVGELDRAHHHFREALELRPDWPAVHFNIGKIYLDQGARQKALEEFRKTLDLNPRYAPAYVEIGIMEMQQGRIDEAIALYRKALDIVVTHVEARLNLSLALKAKAELLEAAGEADEAQELRLQAVDEFGEALKWVPPEHALAAELQQTLYQDLDKALKQEPPNEAVAERIRGLLELSESRKSEGRK